LSNGYIECGEDAWLLLHEKRSGAISSNLSGKKSFLQRVQRRNPKGRLS